ncbi:MAG: pantoate--beta-alanine ligase [Parvularculaceae bacterium]
MGFIDNGSIAVARDRAALRATIRGWRAEGLTVGFAPTMGALHDGHISLVDEARRRADRVVASVFVNPKQFAAHEDLETYPQREATDLRRLAEAGCDLAYLPTRTEMYPPGFQTSVAVNELAAPLCGISRPHFFGGVATVVCKLLNQCRPDIAVFGEKDYQQLLIVRRMAADLDLDVEIVGAPIVREADGLAMSSRNAYLASSARAVAAQLNAHGSAAARRLRDGGPVAETLSAATAAITAAGFDEVEYLEARSADDLTALGPGPVERPARVFAAARLDGVRLIDNWAL